MKRLGSLQKYALGFFDVRVRNTAIYRTNGRTLFFVEMADTLGATHRVNNVDLTALCNSLVWALRLTRSAVDALFCNLRGHRLTRVPHGRHVVKSGGDIGLPVGSRVDEV